MSLSAIPVFDPIERASRDEIAALQTARLAAALRHAYENVPDYRARFDAAGAHPDDFRSPADLAKFPFTVKDDLRRTYPFGLFAVPRERIARLHASSGTTGKPTVVGYTREDLEVWAQVVARSIYAAGGRPGMILHNAYGYGLFTGGLGLHDGAQLLGCSVVPVSGGMTERQVQLITDFRPDIITVTPSYMLAILDEFKRQGLEPRDCSLRIGIFGAEPWTNSMRREMEEGFGLDAVDIYGLSEVMGPGVANECVETKDGLHIWEDHFYPEVIDPETGAVLPEGERGELGGGADVERRGRGRSVVDVGNPHVEGRRAQLERDARHHEHDVRGEGVLEVVLGRLRGRPGRRDAVLALHVAQEDLEVRLGLREARGVRVDRHGLDALQVAIVKRAHHVAACAAHSDDADLGVDGVLEQSVDDFVDVVSGYHSPSLRLAYAPR